MTDKKISELPIATSVNASDISVLVNGDTDYQYTFTLLLQFLEANLSVGANVSFGTTLPQNTTGKNGDVFVNTAAGSFAQKVSGTWTVVYTLPTANTADGTLLYGAGLPASATGKNADSYINTLTGIFYQKSGGSWSQVFSMSTGPQGPQGAAGTNGTNGTNGNTILFGPSNPSNTTTGVNGNFYINTSNFTLFGPKTAGDWGGGVSLLGAGLQTGGTAGQILTKIDGTDFNTWWEDNSFANLSGNATDSNSLAVALATKEDKVPGYQLSQENYTTAEKNKLATLSEHYKGTYTSQTALSTANPAGNPGDYAYVDPGIGVNAEMYIWDEVNTDWTLSSGPTIPDATEIAPGIIELATIAEALARTDDQRAMTALKTISLILDEKKNVYYQIAPVSLNEVSFLMRNAGNITAVTISGASNAKLKIGIGGTYPAGAQTFPFAYAAGDRVFATYNYTDLTNATCNIILTCRDN